MAQWLQMLLSNHKHPLNRLRIPQAPLELELYSALLRRTGAHTHTLIYKRKREGALEDSWRAATNSQFMEYTTLMWAWWCAPVIPEHRRQRTADNWGPARPRQEIWLQNKQLTNAIKSHSLCKVE